MKRVGLALGGVAMIGLGTVFALGWWWPSNSEATEQVDQSIRQVNIDNGSGDVIIRAADVTSATVTQRFEYRLGSPDGGYSMSGDELTLGGCGWFCSVDYEVTVPRGVAVGGSTDSGDLALTGVGEVDVHGGSGQVAVRDVAGAVRLDVSSGDVELAGITADVSVSVGSGNISGTGLRGRVEADSGSGDLDLQLLDERDVTASTGSGDIELVVPDRGYRIAGDSGSGDRQIGVRTDPGAATSLTLETGSGDVTVRAA